MKPIRNVYGALCLAGALTFLLPSVLLAEPANDAIKARQTKILNVVGNSGKAVVGISGIGSGVIVSKEGLILTAAHVMDAMRTMMRDEKEFPVMLADGTEVKAKPLGSNRNRDAALAQITTPGTYPFAEMGSPDAVKAGQWCVAMGHPGGFQVDRTPPVRVGRLWEKKDDAYYRSDCTVSGGDSGGPLFDLDGKVIGIHSSIGERLEENRHVPMSAYKDSWDRMQKGDVWGRLSKLMPELERFDQGHGPKDGSQDDDGTDSGKEKKAPSGEKAKPDRPQEPSSARPFLGVVVGGKGEAGVLVQEVMPDSPAAKAGVQVKDEVMKIDGKDVRSSIDVADAVAGHKVGDKLKLSVKRGGESKDLDVTLEKR